MDFLDFNSSGISSNPADSEASGEIGQLEAKERKLVSKGKYLEAEKVHHQILELKRQQRNARHTQVQSAHNEDQKEMEQQYIEEYNEFREKWREEMQTFKDNAEEAEETLISRQKKDLAETQIDLELKLPVQPKFSPEVLRLQKSAQLLAKDKNYQQADYVQKRFKRMEAEEVERHNKTRARKIQAALDKRRKENDVQLTSLKQKHKAKHTEMKHRMAVELEALMQKYRNFNFELHSNHVVEINGLSGRTTSGVQKRPHREKQGRADASSVMNNTGSDLFNF